LKNLPDIPLKLWWGSFLLFSSVYLLLAFLPYTHVALVQAPPYRWVVWFVAHYALLYWIACFAGLLAFQPRRGNWVVGIFLLVQVGAGLFLPRFMSNLPCNGRDYAWSVGLLLVVVGMCASELVKQDVPAAEERALWGYSTGLAAAIAVAVLAGVGEAHAYGLGFSASTLGRVELTVWSVAAHLLVALCGISVLNLVHIASRNRRIARRWLITALFIAGFWFGLARFLESSLSLHGWRAQLFAGLLAASVVLLVASVAAPSSELFRNIVRNPFPRRVVSLLLCAALGFVIVWFPAYIDGSDWNGFLQSVVVLCCWLGLSRVAYALRPPRANYSLVAIAAVMLAAVFAFKSLQATEIFWSKALGSTDDEIARALVAYAGQDASFNLVHQLLNRPHQSDCGELCRMLREYTNIRDAQAKSSVNLVEDLKPTTGERPDIFIFVVDSLRPDYLGAYNNKVDFTPHLDEFARDSIVIHNAFTQYAGTSLSEPAIWSGMELLHAHYMQPFSKINSLQKLATTDGYSMLVSWDDVLRQLLPADGDMTKLDTDKTLWTEFEVCSTIQQTEQALDAGATHGRPVFFYAQPKNVHQFAHNHLPGPRVTGWQNRSGFNNRVAYEVHQVDDCMGAFFAYLKSRHRYDNSIIILTSDHGDATGEFGRSSHSLSLYPEVMRVPLLIHLPQEMRRKLVYDEQRISALTDIAPTLYYLLGHRPIVANPLFGRPVLAENLDELRSYHRDELFLASDERAVFGVLADHGRYFYATYDSPPNSYLYDLAHDPDGVRDVLTPDLKKEYDQQVITHLQAVADFYGYRPTLSTLVAAGN
jgi:hypothetical protein